MITVLEYAYNASPASMKTIVTAMNAVPNSVASLLVYMLLPLSKDPYYTWNFAVVACKYNPACVVKLSGETGN